MTWDEYEALAKKMTSGEGSEKVYGSHNHTWQALVANWAVQDGKNTLMSEDYSFLKPYYEQALRMQDEGVVQSYANLKTGSIHYLSLIHILVLEESLPAPVTKGQAAGVITYTLGGKKLGEVRVLAAADVEEAGYMDYLKKLAGAWLGTAGWLPQASD